MLAETSGSMKWKLIILLAFFLIYISTQELFAQKDSTNFKGRTSILLEIGGPEMLGVHFSGYLNNRISANAGLGVGLGYHIGTNFNFNRSKYSSIIIGVQVFSIRSFNPFSGSFNTERQLGIYIPLGFEYYAEKGFTMQIDFGPNFVKEDWGQLNTSSFLISVKIGIQMMGKT